MEISGYFILFVFIVTTLVVAFCTWNAVNYFKLKDDNTTNPTLSTTLENALAILNIVLVVLAFIIWCICIYYAYYYFSMRDDKLENLYEYQLLSELDAMVATESAKRPLVNNASPMRRMNAIPNQMNQPMSQPMNRMPVKPFRPNDY
jgi:heme/copper-type cytochrome/quinol oxidase subunit 2